MTPVYPKRDRWLALALLFAVLLLIYGLFVHPWWTVPMREVDQRISGLQERELRVRTLLQQAPQIQQQLQQAREAAASRPGFLAEPSPELAIAGLVQRLETVVNQASPGNRSCAIQNRSPMPDSGVRERFQKVMVNVRLLCGAGELNAVLHALEGGSPRLFIENLDVLSQRYSFQTGAGGSNGLSATFNLAGYLAPAGALPESSTRPLPVPASAPLSTPQSPAPPMRPVDVGAAPQTNTDAAVIEAANAATAAANAAANAADAAANAVSPQENVNER